MGGKSDYRTDKSACKGRSGRAGAGRGRGRAMGDGRCGDDDDNHWFFFLIRLVCRRPWFLSPMRTEPNIMYKWMRSLGLTQCSHPRARGRPAGSRGGVSGGLVRRGGGWKGMAAAAAAARFGGGFFPVVWAGGGSFTLRGLWPDCAVGAAGSVTEGGPVSVPALFGAAGFTCSW